MSEATGSMQSVQRGLASYSDVEAEAVDMAATSEDLLHNRDWKGGQEIHHCITYMSYITG